MTSVVSAVYGNYDHISPAPPQSVDTTFILLVDRPVDVAGWDVRVVPPDGRPARLAAKDPKLRPWDVTANGPWIWIDGAFTIKSSTFVAEALDACDVLGQWTHPQRDCVYDEAAICSTLPRCAGIPVIEQAEHYRQAGHPPHWGLWAAGLIVYKRRLDLLSILWSAEINRWGTRDQVSQPVALRNAGLRPETLPHSLLSNPWMTIRPHRY